MRINTTKIKNSGEEIIRLTNLINNSVTNYYNLVKSISNEAWVGKAANNYVSAILKNKTNAYDLIKCLKAEGNLLIDFSYKLDNKINSLKR